MRRSARRPMLCRRPWWLALLVLSLALAQWQGLVHAVLHTGHVAIAAPAVAAVYGKPCEHGHDHDHDHEGDHHAPSPAAAATTGAWFGHLIPAHDDGDACRLFDQASHADLLLQATALAAPLPAPAALPAAQWQAPPARRPVSTRARDPPATA